MNTDISYKEALERILILCNNSTRYSRRTQSVHNTAMIALGLTFNQRAERHTKIMQRVEQYNEIVKTEGRSAGAKFLKDVK